MVCWESRFVYYPLQKPMGLLSLLDEESKFPRVYYPLQKPMGLLSLLDEESKFTRVYYPLQKPMGLLSLLDEESKFPRSTDHSLAGKLTYILIPGIATLSPDQLAMHDLIICSPKFSYSFIVRDNQCNLVDQMLQWLSM